MANPNGGAATERDEINSLNARLISAEAIQSDDVGREVVGREDADEGASPHTRRGGLLHANL